MTQTHSKREMLEALKAALLSGASEVTFDGETTKFRSVAELRSLVHDLERELGLRSPRRLATGVYMGHR